MSSKNDEVSASVTTRTNPSIFISYSRKNAYFVDRLVRSLEGLGFDCWVDREDLAGGETWREKISLSIRKCQAFVLVISPDSMNSPIVAQEVSLAEFHGRPIIPLMYEVCELPPGLDLQLHKLHWVNFAVEHFDDAMVQLETALWAAANTHNKENAQIQRSLKAWAPWVGSFYFLSGAYYVLALVLFVGGRYAIFSDAQRHYLEGLSVFDQVLWVLIALLHLVGAVFLFTLRHPVVGIFLADWCVYTVYVAGVFAAMRPEGFPTSTLVSYGILTIVVWYVRELRKANLLSSPSNSQTGNVIDVPREEGEGGASPGLNPIKNVDIPNVRGNSPHP